jgi:hypothetical protein
MHSTYLCDGCQMQGGSRTCVELSCGYSSIKISTMRFYLRIFGWMLCGIKLCSSTIDGATCSWCFIDATICS